LHCVVGVADAVPKKRGPKTDVLEALLKRVDGLEQRLKEKKTESDTSTTEDKSTAAQGDTTPIDENESSSTGEARPKLLTADSDRSVPGVDESAIYSPV
jgi:hypothetical protein